MNHALENSAYRACPAFLGNELYDPDGRHTATYSGSIWTYNFADWLGTERVRTNSNQTELCTDMPYGMNLACTGGDTSPMHFTGNQRDTETGLDYFGARYLGGGNGLGRFMTPEYSLDSAIMELPQSWNKYTYEYNRPTYGTDPDGRCPPCIGAVIGGVVEGGFDLGKQLYNNGGQFSQVSWGEVGANVVGGAVAGAIAGATGGASLVANAAVGDVVAGVTSGVVGGVVTRTLDPNTTSDEVLSGGNIAEDAVAGFVGGGAGHMAGDFVHIPDEPTFHLTAKSRRAWKFDIRAGLSANAARNWQQLANQGVRSTVTSSAATHTSNGMWDWFEQWWFNQSPPPENPHSTSQIIYCTDENGNPCR